MIRTLSISITITVPAPTSERTSLYVASSDFGLSGLVLIARAEDGTYSYECLNHSHQRNGSRFKPVLIATIAGRP